MALILKMHPYLPIVIKRSIKVLFWGILYFWASLIHLQPFSLKLFFRNCIVNLFYYDIVTYLKSYINCQISIVFSCIFHDLNYIFYGYHEYTVSLQYRVFTGNCGKVTYYTQGVGEPMVQTLTVGINTQNNDVFKNK